MFEKHQEDMARASSGGMTVKGKGKAKGKGKRTQFEKLEFLRGFDVVCTTCIGVGMSLLNPWDVLLDLPYVVVDEAVQIIEAAALLPLAKGSVQVVMVGDQRYRPQCSPQRLRHVDLE